MFPPICQYLSACNLVAPHSPETLCDEKWLHGVGEQIGHAAGRGRENTKLDDLVYPFNCEFCNSTNYNNKC